jgi:hypothetical protein
MISSYWQKMMVPKAPPTQELQMICVKLLGLLDLTNYFDSYILTTSGITVG